MVNDRMLERLSQYMDGDLDPTETREFEDLLDADPALHAEFSALQELRLSLARLADREHPPAVLDALIEPLMHGKKAAIAVRPWAKILATAAVVVLGATVVFEVYRWNIEAQPPVQPERVQEFREEKPATTGQAGPGLSQPEPEGARPRGAIDRLMASPEPEVELLEDTPPALEVMGPLQTMGDDSREPRRSVTEKGIGRSPTMGADSKKAKVDGRVDGLGTSQGAPPPMQAPLNPNRPEGLEIEQSTTRAKLYVFMEEKTAWEGFEPGIRCESGRYSLRIRVREGIVREVWPVGRPPAAPAQHLRAGEIILGLEVQGVPDGEYAAEVTIEPRARQ